MKNTISARSARWQASLLFASLLLPLMVAPASAQGKLEAQYEA
jgi:hypothetical protein